MLPTMRLFSFSGDAKAGRTCILITGEGPRLAPRSLLRPEQNCAYRHVSSSHRSSCPFVTSLRAEINCCQETSTRRSVRAVRKLFRSGANNQRTGKHSELIITSGVFWLSRYPMGSHVGISTWVSAKNTITRSIR